MTLYSSSGRLVELHYNSSRFDITLSGLGRSVSSECRMGSTCRRYSEAQVSKRGIRHSGVYNDNDIPCS